MGFWFYLVLSMWIMLCILLCIAILLQEGKSLGLGASFGGSGDSLFGASTADVLKKFTAYLSVGFFALAFILSVWSSPVEEPHSKEHLLKEFVGDY